MGLAGGGGAAFAGAGVFAGAVQPAGGGAGLPTGRAAFAGAVLPAEDAAFAVGGAATPGAG